MKLGRNIGQNTRNKEKRPKVISAPYYPPGLTEAEISQWYKHVSFCRNKHLTDNFKPMLTRFFKGT